MWGSVRQCFDTAPVLSITSQPAAFPGLSVMLLPVLPSWAPWPYNILEGLLSTVRATEIWLHKISSKTPAITFITGKALALFKAFISSLTRDLFLELYLLPFLPFIIMNGSTRMKFCSASFTIPPCINTSCTAANTSGIFGLSGYLNRCLPVFLPSVVGNHPESTLSCLISIGTLLATPMRCETHNYFTWVKVEIRMRTKRNHKTITIAPIKPTLRSLQRY